MERRHAELSYQARSVWLIDRVAALSDKSRIDFILDAARRVATTRFWIVPCLRLDSKTYSEFLARLVVPLARTPGSAVLCRRSHHGRNRQLLTPEPLPSIPQAEPKTGSPKRGLTDLRETLIKVEIVPQLFLKDQRNSTGRCGES